MSNGSSLAQVESFSLDALRSGDKAEFSRLVEAFSGRLYRLGLRMLDNPQDAEDILQETFMKAYRGLKNFDGRSSLSTWLYRIAVNEALMLLRKKNLNTISIDEQDEDDAENSRPLDIMDWRSIPETEFMAGEVRSMVDAAIRKLPTKLRLVFLLREIEDLSTEETAAALDLTVTTVKTRLSRARLRLRDELSAYFGDRMRGKANGTQGTL